MAREMRDWTPPQRCHIGLVRITFQHVVGVHWPCTHWHHQMDLDADATDARRYYPPEFWDQKNFNDKQNLNSFRGEGWRNRGAQVNSKLLTQGRDVIRFETPFDIVCL